MYPEFIKGHIYLITNKINNKKYCGQTRSHYVNHNSWKEAGYLKRFQAHLHEAFGSYKYESAKLNRAIRKYGAESFNVELILECHPNEIDQWERYYIKEYDTLNNGYNLTEGGRDASPTTEVRLMISDTLVKLSDDTRLSLLEDKPIKNVKLSKITSCDTTVISLSFRLEDGNTIKVDFGGKLRTVEESIKRAIKFALYVTSEDKIIIQDCLKDLVNLPKAQSDDRLLQNSTAQQVGLDERYEKLKNLKINSIRVTSRNVKEAKLITLIIKHDDGMKQVSFGGKLVSIEESKKNAVDLALKLVDISKITYQQGV